MTGPVARAEILEGDCLEVMAGMEPGTVDAVVTDPPYALAFMGKSWDRHPSPAAFQSWCQAWAAEALRVLKPGGHLLAFGGTRTCHRLTCGIEDAGFEIRDTIAWLYGSGFPKSHDVSKAIDRAAGAEPVVTGPHPTNACAGGDTDAARWQGWGTALKPAHEPVVVARKPLVGTVAANVQQHGTGALNIDAARIAGAKPDTGRGAGGKNGRYGPIGTPGEVVPVPDDGRGRWPANVALDPEAAAMLDEQSGDRPGGNYPTSRSAAQATGFGIGQPTEGGARAMGDTGGASRFFYVAKASSRERNAGLDGFAAREARDIFGDGLSGARPHTSDDYVWQRKGARNPHPTVKPVALMRWLVRLVTPPGGLVLDPFAGSGTTGVACVLEGFDFAGVEREPEYAAIARARIAYAETCPRDFDRNPPNAKSKRDEQTTLDVAA